MVRITRIILFMLCLMIGLPCYGEVSMVVLKFDDNTPYKTWNTAEVMEDLLISGLVDFPGIVLVERKYSKKALAIEQSFNGMSIKDINTLDDGVNKFDAIYDNVVGQASVQKTGDILNLESSQYLGKFYEADYLLHGTIDYLGTSESSFMSPIPKYDFSYKAPCLDAVVTIRIIRAQTGKVVWLLQERGSSKESLWKYRGVTIGSDELNNQLFVEALTKIDKKVLHKLEKDINIGELNL